MFLDDAAEDEDLISNFRFDLEPTTITSSSNESAASMMSTSISSSSNSSSSSSSSRPLKVVEHAEMMIARELNKLSEEEKLEATNDLFGNLDLNDGDGENNRQPNDSYMNHLLDEMDMWIERKNVHYKGYNLALLESSSYVKDRDFKLYF